jgi:hypothetical protein
MPVTSRGETTVISSLDFVTPSQAELEDIESGSDLDTGWQFDFEEAEDFAKLLHVQLVPINYIQLHNR